MKMAKSLVGALKRENAAKKLACGRAVNDQLTSADPRKGRRILPHP